MLRIKLIGWFWVLFPVINWAQAGPPAHSVWDTTFSDDFEGTVLDSAKWDFGFGWGTNSGAFLEINRPENVYVEDGNLVIRVDSMPGGEGWWSGAVNTKNHFSQHKGYFEARMKVAQGNGYVNAFWAKAITEAWPPEIDFVEVLGRNPTDQLTLTVHWDDNGHKSSSGVIDVNTNLSDNFHVYGFEWDDDEFIWYFDGEEVRRIQNGAEFITSYNQPFYMMLNVHVVCKGDCSGWTGWPDETNQFPAYMEVDWVRAYQVNMSLDAQIENPVNDEDIEPGENILISANVFNADGSVSKVEFYGNGNKLGEMFSSPYEYNWQSPPEGRYMLQVVAYDEKNRTKYSEPVYITVGDISDNLILNPFFDNGTNNWDLIKNGTAEAMLEIVTESTLQGENSCLVNITNPGNLVSDLQLSQPVYLKKNVEYNLSFMASSSENRSMIVTVKTEDGKSYQMLKSASVTPQPTEFNYSFTSKIDDYEASVVFSLGESGTGVMIDSIVLKEKPTNILNANNRVGTILYPNPVDDIIHLNSNNDGPVETVIIDLTGKVLLNYRYNGGKCFEIPVNSLSSGIYFLKIIKNGSADTIRFYKN